MLIHLDTERTDDGTVRDSRIAALAYARVLTPHLEDCRIVELTNQYLQPQFDAQEKPYRKADLDGALAAGLTEPEWDACVASAVDFRDAPDPPPVKLRALVLAFGEAVFQLRPEITQLLKPLPPTACAEALKTFCVHIRSLAFDPETKNYDRTKLFALVNPSHGLFAASMPKMPIDAVRALIVHGPSGVEAASGPPSLQQRGIVVVSGAAYRKIVNRNYELIANVVPTAIRSGYARYLIGPKTQRHLVTVDGRPEPLEIYGAIYDPANWHRNDEYRVTIPRPAEFKSLLHHAVAVQGIQCHDPGATQILWVGTYLNDAGKLAWADGVPFPAGEEECPYSGLVFPGDGDIAVFKGIADLFSDGSFAVVLVWDLGAVFKPVFGDAYPHAAVVGRSGAGKTTATSQLDVRMRRRRYSAARQWSTSYRTKKTLANTNVPVIVDEIQRLAPAHHAMVVETLNSAYNLQLATHGDGDKTYVIGTPAMLLGQDLPFEDVALNTKLIRVVLRAEHRDAAALKALLKLEGAVPYRIWLDFACNYANHVDVNAILDQKVERLRGQLKSCTYPENANSGRAVRNYAYLLFTADALAEFGLKLEIEPRVVELLRDHLTLGEASSAGHDRSTIARQFVGDLVVELQTLGRRHDIPWIVRGGDLLFSLKKALEVLSQRGRRYDAVTFDAMVTELKEEGLTFDDHRPLINGVQTRCACIPAIVLDRLGFNLRALGDGAGNDSGGLDL